MYYIMSGHLWFSTCYRFKHCFWRGNGRYVLDKTIFQVATKEQVAILLANAMMLSDEAKELKVYSLPFEDRDDISSVAKPYIYVLYDNDILQGDNEKILIPKIK